MSQLPRRRALQGAALLPLATTGLDRAFTVPVAPFKLRHGGPSVERAPRQVGADTEAVLRELGNSDAEIEGLRAAGAT